MAFKKNTSHLLGLIGSGITLSRTPAMHEHEGVKQNLNILYQLIDLSKLNLDVDALPALLQAAKWMGFSGLNITHPCKQAILPFLDELSDDAKALGAVNTVVIKDGRLIGHNTDWWGFFEGFKRGFKDAHISSVMQLGAGGAGVAVSYALLKLGVEKLFIYDVDFSRADAVSTRLNQIFGKDKIRPCTHLGADIASVDGLVHCTPQGMASYPGLPLDAQFLRQDLWVADIVYFPLETALLKAARDISCQTLDGSHMAVYQAVGAFQLFTGIVPDDARMMAHFQKIDI